MLSSNVLNNSNNNNKAIPNEIRGMKVTLLTCAICVFYCCITVFNLYSINLVPSIYDYLVDIQNTKYQKNKIRKILLLLF